MDTPPPASVPPPAPVSSVPVTEDKTVAIVSYLTLIGFIVAIVLHGNKKTVLGSYHLRQTLGLFITALAGGMLTMIPVIGWLAMFILWPVFFVLWLMGFIAAVNGQMKPIPLLGEKYQEWFKNTF